MCVVGGGGEGGQVCVCGGGGGPGVCVRGGSGIVCGEGAASCVCGGGQVCAYGVGLGGAGGGGWKGGRGERAREGKRSEGVKWARKGGFPFPSPPQSARPGPARASSPPPPRRPGQRAAGPSTAGAAVKMALCNYKMALYNYKMAPGPRPHRKPSQRTFAEATIRSASQSLRGDSPRPPPRPKRGRALGRSAPRIANCFVTLFKNGACCRHCEMAHRRRPALRSAPAQRGEGRNRPWRPSSLGGG